MPNSIRSLEGYTFRDEVARAQTAQLSEEMSGLVSPNLFDPNDPTNTYGKYISSTGGFVIDADCITTDYIPVKAGDVLYFRSFIKNTLEMRDLTGRIAFYDVNKVFVKTDTTSKNICTIENDGYVRLCDQYTLKYDRYVMYTKNTPITEYKPKYKTVPQLESAIFANKITTNHPKGSAGDYPTSLRTGYIAYFEQYADEFGIVSMYRGVDDGTNEMVRVGVTSLQYRCAGVMTDSVEHGLVWKDVRRVIVESINLAQTKVTLITNGGMFEHTFDRPKGYGNNGVWTASTGTIVQQIAKPNDIWIIGDSYMSYDDSRIGGALYAMGVKSPTILSIPGAATPTMASELEKMITFYNIAPRVLVVCTGMNDSAATYEQGVATIKALREKYGFEIIVTRLAVSPIRISDNVAVNAYVDSLNIETVRFDLAVGATSAGVWFDGCMNADNVHPSEAGARLMAAEILSKVGYLESR